MPEQMPAVPSRDQVQDDPSHSLYRVEAALRELESSGGKAIMAVRTARENHAAARQALRQARAKAFALAREQGGKQTVQEREMFVSTQTDEEQFLVDLADIEVRYAADLADERSSVRSSLQTRAKLIMEVMRLAGYAGTPPSNQGGGGNGYRSRQ